MTPTISKPKRNNLAAQEFAKRVPALVRKHPGDHSAPKVAAWMETHCGFVVSAETIRRALKGDGSVDPTNVSLEVLLGLCRYFGCEPKALGRFAARRIEGVWGSFDHTGPDLRINRFCWTGSVTRMPQRVLARAS